MLWTARRGQPVIESCVRRLAAPHPNSSPSCIRSDQCVQWSGKLCGGHFWWTTAGIVLRLPCHVHRLGFTRQSSPRIRNLPRPQSHCQTVPLVTDIAFAIVLNMLCADCVPNGARIRNFRVTRITAVPAGWCYHPRSAGNSARFWPPPCAGANLPTFPVAVI